MSPFERLVRFKNPAGVTFYGEVELKETPTKETLVGASVTVYEGGDPWDDSFKLTEKREQIAEVSHVLAFICRHFYSWCGNAGNARIGRLTRRFRVSC